MYTVNTNANTSTNTQQVNILMLYILNIKFDIFYVLNSLKKFD